MLLYVLVEAEAVVETESTKNQRCESAKGWNELEGMTFVKVYIVSVEAVAWRVVMRCKTTDKERPGGRRVSKSKRAKEQKRRKEGCWLSRSMKAGSVDSFFVSRQENRRR